MTIPNHELLGKRYQFANIAQPLVVSSLHDDTFRLVGHHPPVRYDLPAALVWLFIYEGLLEEV